jgi:hypothetical protein
MSETHRRIVLQFGRVRVVGIFYDFASPAFFIETKTGVDAMNTEMWMQHCTIEDPTTINKSHRAAATPSEMVLYELFKTYCMTEKEKEQTHAGS